MRSNEIVAFLTIFEIIETIPKALGFIISVSMWLPFHRSALLKHKYCSTQM
jgi:hypothetical protein